MNRVTPPKQEEFRREVSAWLKEHVPGGMEHPADPADLTWEQYQLRRELGRKLGDKGWLWPTAPAEYGGGRTRRRQRSGHRRGD